MESFQRKKNKINKIESFLEINTNHFLFLSFSLVDLSRFTSYETRIEKVWFFFFVGVYFGENSLTFEMEKPFYHFQHFFLIKSTDLFSMLKYAKETAVFHIIFALAWLAQVGRFVDQKQFFFLFLLNRKLNNHFRFCYWLKISSHTFFFVFKLNYLDFHHTTTSKFKFNNNYSNESIFQVIALSMRLIHLVKFNIPQCNRNFTLTWLTQKHNYSNLIHSSTAEKKIIYRRISKVKVICKRLNRVNRNFKPYC